MQRLRTLFYNWKRMPQPGPVAEATDRETVICRAVEVIGDGKEAMRWLGTPVPALGYATPISLLDSLAGQTAVLNVLTQLEHGVL
jgi:putative toxin-antitoxin system antitoxin component (TIGR02293 family)